MTDQTRRTAANLMLLCAGVIWGGGFVVMKSALDSIETNYLLALRFSIGAIGLSYFLFSKKHPLNRRIILRGLILGGVALFSLRLPNLWFDVHYRGEQCAAYRFLRGDRSLSNLGCK